MIEREINIKRDNVNFMKWLQALDPITLKEYLTPEILEKYPIAETELFIYICKQCGQMLFTTVNCYVHSLQASNCEELFVEFVEWMYDCHASKTKGVRSSPQNATLLFCRGCQTELGSLQWVEVKCCTCNQRFDEAAKFPIHKLSCIPFKRLLPQNQ